jgi:hypothetical protein
VLIVEWYVSAKLMDLFYTEAVLKFKKLNTLAQQREAVVQGRSLSPYRLRYTVGKVGEGSRVFGV